MQEFFKNGELIYGKPNIGNHTLQVKHLFVQALDLVMFENPIALLNDNLSWAPKSGSFVFSENSAPPANRCDSHRERQARRCSRQLRRPATW